MLFQGFKHSVFLYLFFKRMSSSVESDESYSCNFNILRPSTSKSTQKRLGARDSFTISLLPGSKSHEEISDLAKKIIVGEAYADMRAQQESDKISSEDHIILAISICKAVPQLSDIPPPGSKCTSEDFIYWVCSFTIILPYLHITHYILWLYHSSDLFNNLLFVISGNCS